MKKILLYFTFIFAASCTHKIYLPDSSGQLPETSGDLFKGSVSGLIGSTTSVAVINDITSTPPRENPKEIENLSFIPLLLLNVDLAIHHNFELFYNRSIGIRYQLTGDSRQDGWKSLIYLGSIYRGGTADSVTSGSTEYRSNSKISGLDTGYSIGYRFDNKTLAYSTLTYFGGTAKTEVTQPTQTYNYSDEFSHTGLAFGGQFGNDWFSGLEISFLNTYWEKAGTKPTVGFALNLGYRW